jgi:AcrR family transcriptional regulator/DNA-binding MarR family transcriptional regulator
VGAARQGATRYRRRAGELRVAGTERAPAVGVAELQRARMLHSAVQVVMEEGYGQMSVARVTGRAGVSRRTFYELFEDREACFIAAFDQAVTDMQIVAAAAWAGEAYWRRQIRASLSALLAHLDEHPGVGSLVVVEALGAGPRVLAHRAGLLARLATVVDEGRSQTGVRHQPPALTAEGLVGAVLSVIHARLVGSPREPLAALEGPLVGMILAPYLGSAAARRELEQPAPTTRVRATATIPQGEPLRGLNMRVTYRTLLVLSVIDEHPGASNRQIAELAGVADQGQISKLLTRLENLGLIHNATPNQPTGEPNQWHLTARGQEVHDTTNVKSQPKESK